MLALSNTSATRHILERLRNKFLKIYKQKVFVHHYEKFMGGKNEAIDRFDSALMNCESVIQSYEEMEAKAGTVVTDEMID